MGIANEFDNRFKIDYIQDYYKTKIQTNSNPGIDRINVKSFNKNLDSHSEIISRKVKDGTYNFTPYKEVLIMKGRDKIPRSISLPSIRDKVVLSIVKDLLHEQFNGMVHSEFVKKKIARVIETYKCCKYNSFIKIDMKDFYGSLNHKFLLKKVWKKGRKTEFVHLITSAVTNPTISQNENKHSVDNLKQGVPQGLPISNVLADIYMLDFDKKHSKNEKYEYFRYVDDILILCNKKDSQLIYESIKNELTFDMYLSPHPLNECCSKTYIGSISKGFTYLGYEFSKELITVRKNSKQKIERSIESLFNEYKNTSTSFNTFLWKLNLKITGAIFNSNTYGWLFYYSQIDDERLMFQLDSFVMKLFNRYKLDKRLSRSEFNLKRFVRVYNEIKFNKNNTTYIPDYDIISVEEKKEILYLCKIRVRDSDNDKDIERAFDNFINKNMKELEKDRGNIS